MRERLDEFWITGLYSTFANEPRLSDKAVADKMKELADTLGRTDYPATRTVNKYHDQYNHEPENVKAGYKDLCWPASMEAGLLPWEASAAVLELLAIREHRDEFPRFLLAQGDKTLPIMGRPSVRLARWYWYITQAAPDLPGDWVDRVFQGITPDQPIEDLITRKAYEQAEKNQMPSRYDIASTFATWEAAGASLPQSLTDAIEAYLAYAPWRNVHNNVKYNMAVDTGHIPRLILEDLHSIGFPLKPYPLEAMSEMVGNDLAKQWLATIQAWHSLTEEEKADIHKGIELDLLTAYYEREIQRLRDELQKAGEKEDTDGEA